MTTQRSFMALVAINHFIFAIGGYDYVEKSQLSSIEIYDIEKEVLVISSNQDECQSGEAADASSPHHQMKWSCCLQFHLSVP